MRYEGMPRRDCWLDLVIAAAVLLPLVFGILFLAGVLSGGPRGEDVAGGAVLVAVGMFDMLLFKAIMPASYQVLSDRLRVKMGGPFAFNVSFDTIEAVDPYEAWYHVGISLAPSFRGRVLIRRRAAMDVMISVSDRETFLEQLAIAMRGWAGHALHPLPTTENCDPKPGHD